MKAVICTRYGPPEVLEIQEINKPVAMKNEVLIRVSCAAVTISDCITRSLDLPLAFWLPARLALGFTRPRRSVPGMVFSGTVEAIGSNVTKYRQNDRVFGVSAMNKLGAYAEYICAADSGKTWPTESMLARTPDNITDAEAAAAPYGALLAMAFIKKARIKQGSKVLIYGASGAVGTAAVQIAANLGAVVTGVCGPTNTDLVRSLGASKTIDYTKQGAESMLETYDFIFDAVGKKKSSELKQQCKKALTSGGQYVSVENGRPYSYTDDLEILRDMMQNGKFRAVIDRTFKLEEAAKAQAYVESGHKKGNILLETGKI